MSKEIDQKPAHLISCVGFIMDGNRRWAKANGLPTVVGHSMGKDIFYEVVTWVKTAHIPHAVFYAFSTENWQRAPAEVESLMNIFQVFVDTMLREIDETQVQVKFIGNRADFSPALQSSMKVLEEKSAVYFTTTIWVALSYGGRQELVAACNQAVAKGVLVDEASFAGYLQTGTMPDPDLIIRTGGEQRLSNFLPWQAVYSELFFTATLWPAFTKEEFTRIVAQYGDRQRRRGK